MQKNTKFGKLNEAKTAVGEYAPSVLIVDGTAIFTPTADDYHAAGWKTLNLARPTDPAGDGKHWAENGFEETDTAITKEWKAVDDPVIYRRFSKLKLETELLKRGLLDELDAFLDGTLISGTNYALRRFYDQANELSEDHEMYAAYKSAAQTALGVDDATMEEILEASIVR